VKEIWDFEPDDEFAFFEGGTKPSDRTGLLAMAAERLLDAYVVVRKWDPPSIEAGINQLIQMWCEMRRWKPLPKLSVVADGHESVSLIWGDTPTLKVNVDVSA
jgi:hypothetical protein